MAANETIEAGRWVEITQVVLPADKRPDNVPEDTRCTDLILKVHGFLVNDGRLGEAARIRTLAGRELIGTLTDPNPHFAHDFGEPVPELIQVGVEVREELRGLLAEERRGVER